MLLNRRHSASILSFVSLCLVWKLRFQSYYTFNLELRPHSFDPLKPPPTDVFDYGPVESEAIAAVCAKTEWNPNLVFTCPHPFGGIGNQKNSILICLRQAIATGGSLVVPQIVLRREDDPSECISDNRSSLSFMFDTQHFVDSLRLSCPGLTLHNLVEDIPHYENATQPSMPNSIMPESYGLEGLPFPHDLTEPQTWPEQFFARLAQNNLTMSSEAPLIIELGRHYMSYPVHSDNQDFVESFGSILKFRSDVRRLATKALVCLSRNYSIPMNFSAPFQENAFVGVHLRTEYDARMVWGGWEYGRYEAQFNASLEHVLSTNLSLIYLTSGDMDEAAKYANDMSRYNLTVITKHDLLNQEELEELLALKWDQQALVDFLVMLETSSFGGVGHSSFSWSIALKRHLFAKKRDHYEAPEMLVDELSQIRSDPSMSFDYEAAFWP